MKLMLILLEVVVTLCLSCVLVRSSNTNNQHNIESNLSQDRINPVVVKFNFYKDEKFVRSCFGAHVQGNRVKFESGKLILPADCCDTDKYEKFSLSYGNTGYYGIHADDKYELKQFGCIRYPDYNNATKADNIALLGKVHRHFFIAAVHKGYNIINLPTQELDFSRETLEFFLSSKNTRSELPEEKMYTQGVETKLVNSVWCSILYPLSPIRQNHLCVSSWFNKGLSENDLGAPLIYRDGDSFTLVGLATIVRPWTKLISYPMEFLRIQPYLDWISLQN